MMILSDGSDLQAHDEDVHHPTQGLLMGVALGGMLWTAVVATILAWFS